MKFTAPLRSPVISTSNRSLRSACLIDQEAYRYWNVWHQSQFEFQKVLYYLDVGVRRIRTMAKV